MRHRASASASGKKETPVPPRSPSPSPTSVPEWQGDETESSPLPTVTEDSDDAFFECTSAGCSPRDPAQGPPAQGQASSSSAGPAPAQGPPAQRQTIRLLGETAKIRKKYRDIMRTQMLLNDKERKKEAVRFASTLEKAPPICNRVNSEWKQPAIPCHCHKWPKFFGGELGQNPLG